jgi:pimeloyl-ACP methyl ester carboxylesterase
MDGKKPRFSPREAGFFDGLRSTPVGYDSARKKEILNAHNRHIEEFARGYKRKRPTILFLPGGMGSQIDRSNKPYAGASSLPFTYDTIWIDPGIVFDKDALQLQIESNDHDIGNHICIPNGPLRILVKPYNVTENYFRDKGFNYLVFGFDWRRPLPESADFLHLFLKRLKQRVQVLWQEDPLPNTTILCHSMGGLVAKVFLHRVFQPKTAAADVRKWMCRLVTVATPFYGTATHMTRYYKGQQPLNTIYKANILARLTATFPGPYILMFLDAPTYHRYAAEFEISRYPVRDAAHPDREADPFDRELLGRFPRWVYPGYLDQAARMRKIIARPLPDAVVDRVFHLRALKTKTWVELKWRAVNGPTFNPEKDDSPISGRNGAGDGTVPFWAARLVQVPESQIFNLKKAIKHQQLMEHLETLTVIRRLIELDRMPQTVKVPDKSLASPRASLEAVTRFLENVAAGKIKRTDPEALDEKIWQRIVQEAILC